MYLKNVNVLIKKRETFLGMEPDTKNKNKLCWKYIKLNHAFKLRTVSVRHSASDCMFSEHSLYFFPSLTNSKVRLGNLIVVNRIINLKHVILYYLKTDLLYFSGVYLQNIFLCKKEYRLIEKYVSASCVRVRLWTRKGSFSWLFWMAMPIPMTDMSNSFRIIISCKKNSMRKNNLNLYW